MSAAALLTAASVLIAPSAYRAEVSRLFVAPSWRNRGVGGQLRAAQSRPAEHSGSSRTSKWSNTAPTQPTSISAEGGTSSTDDQPPRRLRTDRTRCFVPTRSNADSGSSYGTNRCELRWTPSVLSSCTSRPRRIATSSQYALSQLRAPSLARCRASFRGSVSHPRPTAADSVVRWTVVRRRPRVPWPPSPSLLAAQADVPAAPSARTGTTQLVVPGQGCSADRRSVTGCPA